MSFVALLSVIGGIGTIVLTFTQYSESLKRAKTTKKVDLYFREVNLPDLILSRFNVYDKDTEEPIFHYTCVNGTTFVDKWAKSFIPLGDFPAKLKEHLKEGHSIIAKRGKTVEEMITLI